MAVISPVSNQTSAITDLKTRVKQLAQKLKDMGAKDGAHRIELVEQQLQHFTVDGAFQYIRRDEILDEAEAQNTIWVHVLHGARNLLSVAPIAFTWYALNLAATAYNHDLTDPHYKGDLYQPFLLLWQESFHGPVIPFAWAAFMDALILTGLVALMVLVIPWYESWRHKKLRADLGGFDGVIDDLLAAIGKDGANSHLAQSDVNKISEAIRAELHSVLMNYDRVTIDTRDFIEKTYKDATNLLQDTHEKTTDILGYTHEKTKEVFDDFRKDLTVYNSDIKVLNNSLNKMDTNLGNYGQKLGELTDASNKLAGSSNELALNAKSMAVSATLSTQASQGISTQLGALNTTQQEIVQTQKSVVQEFAATQKDVLQELTTTQRQVVQDVTSSQQTVVQQIADSQKEVVSQLTNAADTVGRSGENTRDAAKELDRVAGNLEQLTQANFQRMTDGILQANQTLGNDVRKTASEIQQVASGLNGMNTQLAQTSQQLQITMQAFTQAMTDATLKFSQAVDGSSQQFTRTIDDASQKLVKAAGAQPRRRFWLF